MKPEYEKPTAIPLGEALKGSGECTVGSAVLPGVAGGSCVLGHDAGGVVIF